MKSRTNNSGYREAKIARQYVLVHRMVLLAFVGPPPEGHETAHEDGIRLNCALSNLSWKTHRENVADKLTHGTSQAGERHGMARLKASDVAAIRALAGHKSLREIASSFGIAKAHASKIVAGDVWIDPDYTPPPRVARAKITQGIADEIRIAALTESQRSIARRYGLCSTNVSRIVTGKAWR